MTTICIVPNCGFPTLGRSNKCNAHRLTLRRHGHPLQSGLKVTEYGPYRTAIRRLWEANEDSPFWEVLRARWDRLQEHARGVLARAEVSPYDRHEVRAAQDLQKLASNVPFITVACTALALYVLQADRPYLFRDDEAFRFQLIRKVRGLDKLAVYESWNHQRRATRRVYRDMPPRAVRMLAAQLGTVFGEAGLLLRDHPKARPRGEAIVREAREAIESQTLAASLGDF
jgi:hypothetical protein